MYALPPLMVEVTITYFLQLLTKRYGCHGDYVNGGGPLQPRRKEKEVRPPTIQLLPTI